MDRKMKIAICDDEKPIRDYIEKCVREVKEYVDNDWDHILSTFSIYNNNMDYYPFCCCDKIKDIFVKAWMSTAFGLCVSCCYL